MREHRRCASIQCATCFPGLTPTPVPSEADPGTGEREHHRSGDECDPWCPATFPHRTTPTTPDAGDVEALIERLLPLDFEAHESETIKDAARRDRADLARRIALALASHDAATADRVRRETAGGIAAAINQAARRTFTNEQEAAMRDAARIAREAGR